MTGNVLKLNKFGTKAAMRDHGLTSKKRIGRGVFCAVFEGDTPDSVLKLTADWTMRESMVFYFNDPAFPTVLEDYGYVGEQEEDCSLWLLKTERLTRLRDAPASVKKEAKFLIKKFDQARMDLYQSGYPLAKDTSSESELLILEALKQDGAMSKYEVVLEQLTVAVSNLPGSRLDFHTGNLMARGNQLVFNDVLCDGARLL